jgi:hypothetical protein
VLLWLNNFIANFVLVDEHRFSVHYQLIPGTHTRSLQKNVDCIREISSAGADSGTVEGSVAS